MVPCCLVHHLANNYVLKKESPFGKIRLRDVCVPLAGVFFLNSGLRRDTIYRRYFAPGGLSAAP